MELEVHPDELTALGDDWVAASEVIVQQQEALRDRVQLLAGQWSGAAQAAFLAQYAETQRRMLERADELRRSGAAVRDIAEHYAQLDADAADAISA
ncbi:WXG100 family type VII secretion target [Leucobacter musarum]|uniref:WXG100 family type VII secretion target n=1 Tax=Leucobacter musarum TaxID=1930747 RepID=UPI0006A7BAE3|nr:WXG100 family type VII secretion target [Leucobacter musarum]